MPPFIPENNIDTNWNALQSADDLVTDFVYIDQGTAMERIDKIVYSSSNLSLAMEEQFSYISGTTTVQDVQRVFS